jgi:hypothetical protein
MPSDPAESDGAGGPAGGSPPVSVLSPAGLSSEKCDTDGTKNRLPVTARLTSSSRSSCRAVADEHVGEHQLDGLRRAGVADEVGAVLPFAALPKGMLSRRCRFLAVVIDDGGHVVREAGLHPSSSMSSSLSG